MSAIVGLQAICGVEKGILIIQCNLSENPWRTITI